MKSRLKEGRTWIALALAGAVCWFVYPVMRGGVFLAIDPAGNNSEILLTDDRADDASGLNAVSHKGIVRLTSDLAETEKLLRETLDRARAEKLSVVPFGARHSMGKQALREGALHVDTSGFDHLARALGEHGIELGDDYGAMLADPDTAVGAMIGDRSPGGGVWSEYRNFLSSAQADTGKPVFLVSNHQGTGTDPLVVEMTREGIPVLDGIGSFLEGVRCLFEYRDHRARPAMTPPAVADGLAARWRQRLNGGTLDTNDAMALLDDFSIPTIPTVIACNRDDALAAANDVGIPVALKTAEPAIAHKTEVGGVHLGLGDSEAVGAAYDDLASRLGNQVAVSPMASAGVEMILGIINDVQFGPIVMIGTGGVHAETIGDAVFALPPFDAAWARRMVDRLALRPLLDGVRGAPPADIDGLCRAAAQLSALAVALGDAIGEIDINPLIVGPDGCMAVDALVVPGGQQEACHD